MGIALVLSVICLLSSSQQQHPTQSKARQAQPTNPAPSKSDQYPALEYADGEAIPVGASSETGWINIDSPGSQVIHFTDKYTGKSMGSIEVLIQESGKYDYYLSAQASAHFPGMTDCFVSLDYPGLHPFTLTEMEPDAKASATVHADSKIDAAYTQMHPFRRQIGMGCHLKLSSPTIRALHHPAGARVPRAIATLEEAFPTFGGSANGGYTYYRGAYVLGCVLRVQIEQGGDEYTTRTTELIPLGHVTGYVKIDEPPLYSVNVVLSAPITPDGDPFAGFALYSKESQAKFVSLFSAAAAACGGATGTIRQD